MGEVLREEGLPKDLCADSLEEGTHRNEDHVFELQKNIPEVEEGIEQHDNEILAVQVIEYVITSVLSNTMQEENKVGYSTKNGKPIAEAPAGSGKFRKQTSSSSPKSG